MTITLTVRDTMEPHQITVIGEHYSFCQRCCLTFDHFLSDRCPNEILGSVPWQP